MRAVTWNVNGLRALLGKGIVPWEAVPGAEVVALQEIKASPAQLGALAEPAGWHAAWCPARKPGYSGTALLSRRRPDEIAAGLGDPAFDDEGRTIAMRFGDLVVISAYFPNSQEGGARLAYKLAYCAAMEGYLARWRARGCETLLLGDYNIAHRPIDLARPEDNEESPGYLPEERAWFSRYLQLGYRDVFRERYPELTGAYTWWSFRARARERNIGWRIDYATTSPQLAARVREIAHHPEIGGSDHCPVSVTLA